MRQWQGTERGAPASVLTLVDAADRPVGPTELRLSCDAVGLNFLDVMVCRGTYPSLPPPPYTPGVEVVGTVVEAGSGTTTAVGSRVVACPALPRGALGERVVIDEQLTVEAPPGAAAADLAALPVNYQTAWFALRRAGLGAGDTVLVHAGAGGVGIATIQLAVAAGAIVIATAGGPAKTALCLAQGAHHAIDYRAVDFAAVVRDLTSGAGADVVIDPVGGDVFARSLSVLALEGRIVPIGAAGGMPAAVDPMALTAANISIVGLSWGSTYPYRRPDEVRTVYRELFGMLGSEVRPVIDREVPLVEAARALTDLEERRTVGKVVVRPLA